MNQQCLMCFFRYYPSVSTLKSMFLLPLLVLVWEFHESRWYLFNLVLDIQSQRLLVFKKFNLLCKSSIFLEGSFLKENLPSGTSSLTLFKSQNILVLSLFYCFLDNKYNQFYSIVISDFNRELSYLTLANYSFLSFTFNTISSIFMIRSQIRLSFSSIIF